MSHRLIDKYWYGYHPLRWLLYPFSLAYQLVISIRRLYLKRYKQQSLSVPVIVVGNLTVGGVGKTPFVIALAEKLQACGLGVGIVSRGYGSQIKQFPYEVNQSSDVHLVGDEPLLIAEKTNCPVVIAPRRMDAIQLLLKKHACQIILSDDGLQHYRMARSVEIVIIDGERRLGNQLCLPAGPLREPPSRLKSVDFIIVNGGDWFGAYRMDYTPGSLTNLRERYIISPDKLDFPVAAVAGIGNPRRFYATLDSLGLTYNPYSFSDHYCFKPADLAVAERSVVMTEKDAIKCRKFANEKMYYLPVNVNLSHAFWTALFSHPVLKDYL